MPARLIGHRVTVRLYPDEVLVLFGGKEQERCPRLHGQDKTHVNYRHVIPSLVRKPGAFARYRWREALFPSLIFRRAYDALKEGRGERADAAYLKILELAATTMECDVEAALEILLDQGRAFDFREVQGLVEALRPEPYQLEDLQPLTPCLNAYSEWGSVFPNRLLGCATVDRLRHNAHRVVIEGDSFRSPRPTSITPKRGTSKGSEKRSSTDLELAESKG